MRERGTWNEFGDDAGHSGVDNGAEELFEVGVTEVGHEGGVAEGGLFGGELTDHDGGVKPGCFDACFGGGGGGGGRGEVEMELGEVENKGGEEGVWRCVSGATDGAWAPWAVTVGCCGHWKSSGGGGKGGEEWEVGRRSGCD